MHATGGCECQITSITFQLSMTKRKLLLFTALSSTLLPVTANADTVSASGGLSFGRNSGFNDVKSPAPTLGAEYTFGLGAHIQLGGFFEKQLLQFSDTSSGSLNFMGAVLKYYFGDSEKSGPFVYGKGGLGSMSNNTMSSDQKLCGGGGLGYQFALNSLFSISPRMGVSFLPDSPGDPAPNEARYDGSLMFSFSF
jgi:hypothetical protein